MTRLLASLLCTAAFASAVEKWELFHAPGDDTARLSEWVRPHLPQGAALRILPLPLTCENETDARRQARAIEAGVTALPCLVFRDEKGPYAALPLNYLSEQNMQQARQHATAPGRETEAHRHTLTARLFMLRFYMNRSVDPAEQDRIIARLHELMQDPTTPEDMRQIIGLNCLYPAIMQQYAAEYRGAHTPRTEAKLLEAIRVIESVRDSDPKSYYGRRAYEEREKLRAARLKSRQYE